MPALPAIHVLSLAAVRVRSGLGCTEKWGMWCMRQGQLEAERRAELVRAGRTLKEQLALAEVQAQAAEDALQREAQKLPNLTHPQAPLPSLLAIRLPCPPAAGNGLWVLLAGILLVSSCQTQTIAAVGAAICWAC